MTIRIAVAAAMIAFGAYAGPAAHDRDKGPEGQGRERYTVGLFGDMPYNTLGRMQYPALLADINAHHVAFSMFDGDLKAGGDGPCADSLYTTAISNFNRLERPLIWVPGDNDWTDCWGRYGPGTLPYFDPIERLMLERSLFASTDQSLGQKTLTLTRQSSEGGAYGLYSENIRWKYGPVVYIGLNVQGSNDNYPYHDTDADSGAVIVRADAEIQRERSEELARKAANIHWLAEGFAYAIQVGARGVVVLWQADPNFNNEQKLANLHEWDAFPDYVNALAAQTMAFAGQVALVHGDGHYFKIDQPLNGPNGGVLTNFTRVETFGARNTHWVRATIDPENPNLFSFDPMIVPANR